MEANFEVRFRNKIVFTQFLLAIGVVYQHTIWNYTGSNILNAVQSFLFYLLEACVPFFFMISGYLFFRTYVVSKIGTKLLSRVKTLLIPYLLWNIVYTVFIVGFTALGFIHNAVISDHIGGVLFQLINAEFSPLWFMKYLMIFTLVAPVFYYLLRTKIGGGVTILGMLALNIVSYYAGIMRIPLNVNSNSLVMFNYQYIYYAVGAYCALNWKEFVEIPTYRKRSVASVMMFVLLLVYCQLNIKQENVIVGHFFRLLYNSALWFALDYISIYKIRNWMKNSFFLYCSHLIVLQCIQRVCDIIIEKTTGIQSILYVLEYIFLPLIVVTFLMLVAEEGKKYLPKMYGVLTGKRG